MTKYILLTFGVISRIVFEYGVPVLCWILWGWHIGVAMILWYLLWAWVGYTLIQSVRFEEEEKRKEFEKNKDAFLTAFNALTDELNKNKKEKNDDEHKTL